MNRRSVLLILGLCLLIPVSTRAAGNEPSRNANEGPAFLRHLPATADSFVYVPNPLPWMRALLTSPRLVQAIESSGLVTAKPGAKKPSEHLQEALQKLELQAEKFPVEVALATTASAPRDLITLVRLGMLVGAGRLLATAGPEAQEQCMPLLRQDLLAVTSSLAFPRLMVWLRLSPQPRTEAMYNQIAGSVKAAAGQKALTLDEAADHVAVGAKISNLVPVETIKAQIAALMGVSGEDGDVARIADRVGNLEVKLAVHLREDGLRFSLGDWGPEADLPLAGVPPGGLWSSSPDLVIYSRWDARSLLDGMNDIAAMWSHWAGTAVEAKIRELDTNDSFGSLARMKERVEAMPLRGEAQLMAGSPIHGTIRSDGAAPAPELAASPILQFIPRTTENVFADNSISFGEWASRALDQFEDRLERQKLKFDLKGQSDRVKFLELFHEAYYKHLADFRKILHEEAPRMFLPGMAYVWDAKGKPSKIELKAESEKGEVSTLSAKEITLPRNAFIGRVADPQAAIKLMGSLHTSFLAGKKVEDNPAKEGDLGLGVPTYTFPEVPVAGGQKFSYELDGEMQYHMFVMDDFLIYSTSPALSKEIITARKGTDADRFVVAEKGDGKVFQASFPGDSLRSLFHQAADFLKSFDPKDGRGKVTGPMFEFLGTPKALELVPIVKGLGNLLGFLDEFRIWAQQKETSRETHMTIRLTP